MVAPRRHLRRSEVGAGLIDTLIGFVIFTLLLLVAAQVIVRLYATSTLTSAATRAASMAADSGNPAAEIPSAEAAARAQLGGFGTNRTSFVWKEADANQVVLEVRGESPAFLPVPASWRKVTRTVTVRTESFR